jgi:signal transduction histidine kinase
MPGTRPDGGHVGQLADEQAALRRVATLVARGVGSREIFDAISNEVRGVLGCEQAVVERFDADGPSLAIVGASDGSWITSVGDRWELEDFLASTTVYRTGRAARFDLAGARNASGPLANHLREIGFISTVATPILVEGSLWGAITVADTNGELPSDTEVRVGNFAEVAATAIANAESRAELAASEARAHELAREQAALRRVATLVAEGTNANDLFAAVAQEVSDLCDIPVVGVHRFEADKTFTMMGLVGATGHSVGDRGQVDDVRLAALILDTVRPARWEHTTAMPRRVGAAMRDDSTVQVAGAPIVVDGSVWGFIAAGGEPDDPLPDDTENRLARFTELVATAIANSQAREHLSQLAEEQAALRRVATTVARGSPPDQVFAQVAEEVGLLLGVEVTGIHRFEPNGYTTVVMNWGEMGDLVPVNRRVKLDGDSVTAQVHRTGRPARIDSYDSATGPIAEGLRKIGMRAGVGSPITVNGRLWGAIAAVTSRADPLPAGSEDRIAEFTELVATAIANVEARTEVRRLVEKQEALRRVATLVATGARPVEVFSAVSVEIGGLFSSDQAAVARFEQDGSATVVGVSDCMPGVSVGSRWQLADFPAPAAVYRTGRPARNEQDATSGSVAKILREVGPVSTVAGPIVVEGDLWGVITVVDMHERLPPDAEERLQNFTELVATAVANAESRAELAASRIRVIAAADDARRRIERDLHDGAQQRLVTLAVALRRAQAKIPSGLEALRADVTRIAEGLTTAAEELREVSRGIHPAVLTEAGLSPALRALGRRSPVRVKLDVRHAERLPEQVEVAAYYTVSEALTNASKHARATHVSVSLSVQHDTLHLSVQDDGIGGADPALGSGLIGLSDRIKALGGTLEVKSPPRMGTRLDAVIPICFRWAAR